MIQNRIVHTSHVMFLCLRSINTDVTTPFPQEIQPWIPWLLKKELIQLCINITNQT